MKIALTVSEAAIDVGKERGHLFEINEVGENGYATSKTLDTPVSGVELLFLLRQ